MTTLFSKGPRAIATGFVLAATALAMTLSVATAAPVMVPSNINVRSGPGTDYGIVTVTRAGEAINVQKCDGAWCFVTAGLTQGWVAKQFITGASPRPAPAPLIQQAPQSPHLKFAPQASRLHPAPTSN